MYSNYGYTIFEHNNNKQFAEMSTSAYIGNALSGFGKDYAIFGAIIATIISCIFILAGIDLFLYTIPTKKTPNPKMLGLFCILMGTLCLAFAWGQVWLTQNNRFYAQGSGAVDIFDLASGVYHNA